MHPNAITATENAGRWGVNPGPALWPAVLRILFVIDGRIDTSVCQNNFGLGYVLETLRDPSFAWWVRFRVQVVRRDEGQNLMPACESGDVNYTEAADPPFSIISFRLTEAGFNIDEWDQIWFFGDFPANSHDAIDEPKFSPLDHQELKLLAEWMDRGGGVFATGDHWNLGASMCSRIPRVRTMRRWTVEQGVPTMDGDRRNQTLQPGPDEDLAEGDAIPQPIEVVYRRQVTSIVTRRLVPHALLDTPTGVIDRFPDHMHEGQVIDDDRVEIDTSLDIPGYVRPEYPSIEPEIDPGIAAAIDPNALVQIRPRPRMVAYGRTTNPAAPEASAGVAVKPFGVTGLFTRPFGLISGYDGDRVGIGRVVVDSTWHHWFSYNIHGFKKDNPVMYAAHADLLSERRSLARHASTTPFHAECGDLGSRRLGPDGVPGERQPVVVDGRQAGPRGDGANGLAIHDLRFRRVFLRWQSRRDLWSAG